jgi:hypothetical protein
MTPRLLRAWRQTKYEVNDIVFHVGRRSPELDALLRGAGVRSAVLIGADNPFSRRMPDGWNRRMRARLAERLRRRIVLPAFGTGRGWCEQHFFVLGPVGFSQRIARVARQNGIVIIKRGQPPTLWTSLPKPAGMESDRRA